MIDIYVDGSFKPKNRQGAYGIVIMAENCVKKIGGKIGRIKDNNVAEYYAVLRGLNELKWMKLNDKEVKLHTDAYMILQQLTDKFCTPKLREYKYWYMEIIFSLNYFSKCVISFIKSRKNPAHAVVREVWYNDKARG
jgi:ribonuclease HI